MPFDYGLRLDNRQRIANAREKPIKANKNQSVDGTEGLFLRSVSPQNVYLLPQRQNFRLERCPRPKLIYDRPNNEPNKISRPATASPDSRSTASQIEFATGTPCGDVQFWRKADPYLARSLRCRVEQPTDLTHDSRKSPFSLLDTQFAAVELRIESQIGRFVNIGAANHMDTFDKRISPQVIQEIRFSACRGHKLRPSAQLQRAR
jgi:hypothetical protein